jgi:outer membrane protein TolC
MERLRVFAHQTVMFSHRWPLPFPPRALLFAVVVAVGATGARAQTGAPGALAEELLPGLAPILRRAVERSPDAIKRGLELEQAEARTYVSRGAMLPNLAVNGRYGVNQASTTSGTNQITNNSSGFYYDVGLNQPLYHWGALRAQADIDQIAVKIAAREYADAARLLVGQVRARYLELVTKKSALRRDQFQFELATKTLAALEDQLAAGRVTAAEVAAVRVGLQMARLGLDQKLADLAYSKRALQRLAGLEDLPDDAIPAQLPTPAPAADRGEGMLRAFLGGGATETDRGRVFTLGIARAELDFRIAKTGLYPKFFLNLSHNVSNSTQAGFGVLHQEAIAQNSVSLGVNWTVFDGLATRGRTREALARKRVNERQLQTYVEATADAAQNLRQLADFAARALDFAENARGGAREVFLGDREVAARGHASPDDVATSDAGVLAAETTATLARAEFLNRWADFVSLVGADPVMKLLPPRYVR